MKRFLVSAMAVLAAHSVQAEVVAQGVLSVVAAENFYGEVAQRIGGPQVAVTSILSNPNQDPHLFEATPSTARAASTATIVVVNGARVRSMDEHATQGITEPQASGARRRLGDRSQDRRQSSSLV